jgi:ribosomal-protein-alanine N-acetyltransferase
MLLDVNLELAKPSDAERIASMSRTLIEAGLGWRWTSTRIHRQIRSPDTLVLVARTEISIIGFAIMHFLTEDAHLLLLAVSPPYQRRGTGRRLLTWLEKSARVAGIASIHLEVRAVNLEAQSFYRALGFRQLRLVPGYYNGREAAVRMIKNLRNPSD